MTAHILGLVGSPYKRSFVGQGDFCVMQDALYLKERGSIFSDKTLFQQVFEKSNCKEAYRVLSEKNSMLVRFALALHLDIQGSVRKNSMLVRFALALHLDIQCWFPPLFFQQNTVSEIPGHIGTKRSRAPY